MWRVDRTEPYGIISVMKRGKLIDNHVHLQDHEWKTVDTLLDKGNDIELIPAAKSKNHRKPDILMGGIRWEIKAPKGDGKRNAQNKIQDAVGQSPYIIIDLFRCKMAEPRALRDFEREFRLSKPAKRLMIIKKNREILDFSK